MMKVRCAVVGFLIISALAVNADSLTILRLVKIDSRPTAPAASTMRLVRIIRPKNRKIVKVRHNMVQTVSRGGYRYRVSQKPITARISYYHPGCPLRSCRTGWKTASGKSAAVRGVAADPRIAPLGARIRLTDRDRVVEYEVVDTCPHKGTIDILKHLSHKATKKLGARKAKILVLRRI